MDQSYCIACKDRSRGPSLWLGGIEDGSGAYWCDVEEGVPQPGAPEFWSVSPIVGTDAYYLLNQTSNLYAYFSGEGSMIALRPLDVFDPGFIIKLDNVGDGWVAINNSAKDGVFTAQDQPASGSPVTGYPWKDENTQKWMFVNANTVMSAGPGIDGSHK